MILDRLLAINHTLFTYQFTLIQPLKKIPKYGIRFKIPNDSSKLWDFYVDADWAGDIKTRKSTIGYIIKFMGGHLITKSRRARIVMLPSTEAILCVH